MYFCMCVHTYIYIYKHTPANAWATLKYSCRLVYCLSRKVYFSGRSTLYIYIYIIYIYIYHIYICIHILHIQLRITVLSMPASRMLIVLVPIVACIQTDKRTTVVTKGKAATPARVRMKSSFRRHQF